MSGTAGDPIPATYDHSQRGTDARMGEVIDLTQLDTEMRPDPPSHPDAEASERTAVKVLRNTIAVYRARGVTHIDIDQLEAELDRREQR